MLPFFYWDECRMLIGMLSSSSVVAAVALVVAVAGLAALLPGTWITLGVLIWGHLVLLVEPISN